VARHKLAQFAENETFSHVFYMPWEELQNGFDLKGNWKKAFFKNDNPITLELGCGKGEYTVGLARKYPNRNFIGIDLKGSRMWHGASVVQKEGLKNVAFIRTKIDLLLHYFAANEVAEIWLTFSDPQPKRERRRLSSPLFLNLYREVLESNGIIHQKTDNRELFEYTLDVVNYFKFPLDYFSYDVYASDSDNDLVEIQTYYEKMFLKDGIPINYMKFRLNENFASNKLLVLPKEVEK
jgi:tRNA (guanine-N7-)-methyltransferase